MKSKRWLLIAAGFVMPLAVGCLAAFSNADALIAVQIRRMVVANFEANDAAQALPDSRFELLFCGTGTPRFNPDRAQPFLAVIAGGRLLLFGAGLRAARRLERFAAPTEKLAAVFARRTAGHRAHAPRIHGSLRGRRRDAAARRLTRL